jgi:hypothetical protein
LRTNFYDNINAAIEVAVVVKTRTAENAHIVSADNALISAREVASRSKSQAVRYLIVDECDSFMNR